MDNLSGLAPTPSLAGFTNFVVSSYMSRASNGINREIYPCPTWSLFLWQASPDLFTWQLGRMARE